MIDQSSVPLTLVIAADPGADPSDAGEAVRGTLGSASEDDGERWDEVLVTGIEAIPVVPGQVRPLAANDWTDATSDYVVFLPAGARLVPDAAARLRELIVHNPTVDVAYFDSAGFHPGAPDELVEAYHRPGFSPDRLRAQMYLGDMLLVRRSLAEDFDPHGDHLTAPVSHAVAGRLTAGLFESTSGSRPTVTVLHLPHVLYHQPTGNRPTPVPDRLAGHQLWLEAEEFPATAMLRPGSDTIVDLEPRLIDTPKVSVVIPTNGADRNTGGTDTVLCLQAIESIITRTTYIDFELVVVITPGGPADLANRILATIESRTGARRPTVRFCRDDREFNFSNACNRGAVAAAGDVLVFLNDDTVIQSRNWLDRLVMYATRPDIGAVGARLLYGGGSIQHAGIWSRDGHPNHRYERFRADHRGYMDSLLVPQNCLAVTGACLAVETAKFMTVGGFSPDFPSSYNDVDLCLKLDDLGYRTVVDPGTVLTHYEASSRDPKIEDWELALLHERWRSLLNDDPHDNPNHLAPAPEEYPPPDPLITDRKRQAGWVDFLPRSWPRKRLTVDPRSTGGQTAARSGGGTEARPTDAPMPVGAGGGEEAI